MSKLILLVVGAAWAAVLLPPLLRSRVENRPGSSVSSFRRQLSSLQRSVPSNGMAPMRSMARPLAGAPRPGATRSPYAPSHLHRVGAPAERYDLRGGRPLERRADVRVQRHHSTTVRASRSTVKQRRQNVLFVLVLTTGVTAALAATTHSSGMKVALVVSVCLLVGYVYMLAQSRRQQDERFMRDAWQRAA